MSNYAHFFMLFNEARRSGLMPYAEHHELVSDATQGRTASLRDLSSKELRDLEQRIVEMVDPAEASMQRQRRKIIAILASRGCTTPEGRPDMAHIHAWVERYGYLHKPMNDYTNKELPRLVTQAEAIVASDLKAVRNA
jgi:hypothetical protein